MKRTFLTLLLLVLTLSLCACGYQTEYTDPASYPEIWERSGLWLRSKGVVEEGAPLPLFPTSLEGTELQDFYCRYDENLPVGESFQIHVALAFPDGAAFDAETERLSRIAPLQEDPRFSLPAAVAVLGWEQCSEYALADPETRVVHYIYLQSLTREQIVLPAALLPAGYAGYGDVEGACVNVYLPG